MTERKYIQQLVDYIKRNVSKGYSIDVLKIALLNQGYFRSNIDKAVEIATKEMAEEAPRLKEKPVIKYELYDESNKAIEVKPRKSFWKWLFG